MINYIEPYQQKLQWYRSPRKGFQKGFWLICRNANRASPGLLEEIQNWSKEHNCGVRRSWDSWKFKNKHEITMFLLKWS